MGKFTTQAVALSLGENSITCYDNNDDINAAGQLLHVVAMRLMDSPRQPIAYTYTRSVGQVLGRRWGHCSAHTNDVMLGCTRARQ